jgi:hypothetical protein
MMDSQMAVDPAKTLVSIALPADGSGTRRSDAYLFAASLNAVGGGLKYGDVDGSGNINTADAVLALKCVAGLATLDTTQVSRADVSPRLPDGTFGDGAIQVDDTVGILRLMP